MRHGKLIFFLALMVAAPLILSGVETAFWQIGTFEDLLQGTLRGVSLTKDGSLRLAPAAGAEFTPDETMALAIVADRERRIYVGTGHQGKVFKADPSLKGSLFFTAAEPDVFALATGPDGALYVGSSPEGKIYRVTPDGKSKVFYDPKVKYIWALLFDAQGRLYAGTGDRGLIFRIDPNGKGEIFFDSKQTHIMCLTQDAQGNLLAGSVPNGLIYRITPQGKGYVLYQANLPEIHDLAVDSQGRIYAAALGGPGGRGTPQIFAPQGAGPAPAVSASVTVTAATGDVPPPPAKEQTPPGESPRGPSFNRPAPATGFPTPPLQQGRGSLIKILPDYTAETAWTSNNESIFGLAIRDNKILFSTDSNGRIFELKPSVESQELTLLTETHESLATRLLVLGPDVYVATSNIAKLIRLGAAPASEGTYESPVKDTKFISRWGVLAWRAETPAGTSLEFYSRSGNSERPDSTWSDWSGPYRNAGGAPVQSPPARFLQWKAVFRSTGANSPILDDVTVSYLNQNLAPEIRSFTVSGSGERTGPAGIPSPSGISAGGGISSPPSPSSGFGASSSTPGPPVKTHTSFSWQADDPNGDALVYSIYVKATDEQQWHLLKDKLHQTSYTVEANTLADGKYVAKLIASDEESNPPATSRRSELLSAPFWVDNTPPQVRTLKQTPLPGGAEVKFQVEDATSPLRAAEFSVDGNEWRDVPSDDGIVDSRVESFTIRVQDLKPGEHIITLRAYDTVGNAGMGKAVVSITAGAAPSP